MSALLLLLLLRWCFELAALPGTTAEEAQRVLNFVVVGGGPTGEQ